MKHWQWLVVVVASFLLVACGKPENAAVLETNDGNTLTVENWQGKWVYINYWADWCKPCAEEIPELNAFAAENADVLVLGVNFDGKTGADLLKQVNAFRIDFPVITNDVRKAFPHEVPAGLPATLVFRPSGELADTLQGPQTRATLAQAKNL